MRDNYVSRRTFLKSGVIGISSVSLSGCLNPLSGGQETFDGWMAGVTNYDKVEEYVEEDPVTVKVGDEGNGGNYAFSPPVISIPKRTTVKWVWTGEGANQHTVSEKNKRFESRIYSNKGAEFKHTFSETGVYKYYCVFHHPLGEKGVVIVRENKYS